MWTRLTVWLQYVTTMHNLKRSRIKGYDRLETGSLYPTVESRLFDKGYEQYTQGGILSPKRCFWTTSPVEQSAEEQEG